MINNNYIFNSTEKKALHYSGMYISVYLSYYKNLSISQNNEEEILISKSYVVN